MKVLALISPGSGLWPTKTFRSGVGTKTVFLVADFFDDKNMEPGPICTEPQPCDWHPRIDSVVYHGMDWNCPTYTERLGQEIKKHWGQITPELIISDIIAKVRAVVCGLDGPSRGPTVKVGLLWSRRTARNRFNEFLRPALVMSTMQSMI